MDHVLDFFKNKAIDFYVLKRQKGESCEVAYTKTFLQLHDVAFLSMSKMNTQSEISKVVAISNALLTIKKDKRLSQMMEDAYAFSKIGKVKPEHLKLIMQ
jgi:hypothetical protein